MRSTENWPGRESSYDCPSSGKMPFKKTTGLWVKFHLDFSGGLDSGVKTHKIQLPLLKSLGYGIEKGRKMMTLECSVGSNQQGGSTGTHRKALIWERN